MSTRKIALSALCATLVIGAASASFARPQGHGDKGGPGRMQGEAFVRLLKLADANKDGQITKDEFTTAQEALFTAIDADKDGSLTPKEFREYREAKMEAFRKEHPRPEGAARDGAPPAADGTTPPPPPHEKGGDKGRHGEGKHHGGKDGPREHGKGWGKGHEGGMLRMLDTDENGQVSKAEFTAGAEKLFERMDRNKDGVINIDDIPDRPFP